MTRESLFMEQRSSGLRKVVLSGHFIPVCFAIALVVRLCWLYFVPAQPISDFKWYYDRAVEIASGNGYSVNGRPTAYFPVGYPGFLAAFFFVFGPSVLLAKALNVLLYMGILVLTYLIGRRTFESEFVGRAAVAVLAVFPSQIAYSSLLASEILFLFLAMLGVACLVLMKPTVRVSIAAGIVFGLIALVKPLGVLMPTVVLVLFWLKSAWREDRLAISRQFLVLNVVMLMVLAPWLVRNHKVFHHFMFISNNGGVDLYVGNGPEATGTWTRTAKTDAVLGDPSHEYERDRKGFRLAIDLMARQPVRAVCLLPKKLRYLYATDIEGLEWNRRGMTAGSGRIPDADRKSGWRFVTKTLPSAGMARGTGFFSRLLAAMSTKPFLILIAIAQVFYIFVCIAFVVSLVILFRARSAGFRRTVPTLGIWIMAYLTLVYMVFFGGSRFHFPVVPWMTMYVGALAEVCLSRGVEKHGLSSPAIPPAEATV